MNLALCTICTDPHDFAEMRSLPCGHTYCGPCIDSWCRRTEEEDMELTCPECRREFEPGELRKLFLTLFTSSGLASPPAEVLNIDALSAEEPALARAKTITTQLHALDGVPPPQSMIMAADALGGAAAIRSEEAQGLLWTAVRQYLHKLTPRTMEEHQALREQIHAVTNRLACIEQTVHRTQRQLGEIGTHNDHLTMELQREREKEKASVLEGEISQLTETIQTIKDTHEQDRQRERGALARLKARETKLSAQVKELQRKLRSRQLGAAQRDSQPEGESLVVETDIVHQGVRSHRLEVYNANPGPSKRRRVTPEAVIHDDNLDDFDGLSGPSSLPSPSLPEPQTPPPDDFAEIPPEDSPKRPQFGSDWNLRQDPLRRLARSRSDGLPFPVDAHGRPKGLLQGGSRVRMRKK
ncbi:hypothetical protein BC834DRAFT_352488 [Gloeopeniophorella convolvens]|nr:hypothetical protein BC834DRAFT_352488 [Gloeopeniophorella convolvens]